MKQMCRVMLALLALIALFSCADADKVEPKDRIDYSYVKMDVTSGNPADIPIPNDILRNPATGQISLPFSGEPYDSLNSLTGFSTSAPITIPFTGLIQHESVTAQSVLVIDLATGTQPTVSYSVADHDGNSTVTIIPVVPMAPGHPHAVVVTQGVLGASSNSSVLSDAITLFTKDTNPLVDASGHSLRGALSDSDAQALEPLRQAYQGIWGAIEMATGMQRGQIPLGFLFTTQPLHQTLPVLRQKAQELSPAAVVVDSYVGAPFVDAVYQSAGLGAVPHSNIGALYKGTFNAPLYNANQLTGHFTAEGADVAPQGSVDVPFWAALPAGASGPVPVVIFQHGFTSKKEAMLAMADAACSQGVGVIAMDALLHGERVGDFFNNETGAVGPDGQLDPSGTGVINPGYPRTMRDNFRQTIFELMVLTRMIATGATDMNGDTVPEFAPTHIAYAGQSMGGIIGGAFTVLEPTVTHGVLNVPGGRFLALFPNSQEVAPLINSGLAAQGILPGSAEYALFFLILQTVLDDVDPFNYGPYAANGGINGGTPTHVLIQEILDDTVVPNISTEDMARAFSCPQVDALRPIAGLPQVAAPHVGTGIFQFEGGSHSFLLNGDPPTGPGQLQMMTYLLSGWQGTPTIVNPYGSGKTKRLSIIPEHTDVFGSLADAVRFP
jgi:dienelactone hydrolase